MTVDSKLRERTLIAYMPEDVDDYAWLPNGDVVAPENSRLLQWSPALGWRPIAEMREKAPDGISHLVVNSRGNQMLVVLRVK